MIKLKDVSKYYNSNGITTVALEHINLEFNKGDIVAITGESGSGKSTLLNVICANDTYNDGEIYFNGEETSYFDVNDADNFKAKYVGFIYQNYNIIDSYTVLQNVMFPLLIKGMDYDKAKEKALELIAKVGLSARVKHRGTKLSGGEKQRVVIARALAQDPLILACDEMTGNLDSNTSKEIINLIKEVAKDKLVLIVTHNYEEVKDIVTRKVTLVDGHIIEDRVIKEVNDIDNTKMDLSPNKLSFKNILRFTSNNLLGTPKKSIFAFMIMFVMSFIILTMFSSLSYSYSGTTRITADNALCLVPNYYVINNKDYSALNLEDFTGINYNKYSLYNKYITSDSTNYELTNLNISTDMFEGRMPQTEDEIVLFSSYSFYQIALKKIDNTVFYESENKTFKVVGVGRNRYLRGIIAYTPFESNLSNNNFNYDSFIPILNNDLNLKLDVSWRTDIDKVTIYLPKNYEFNKLEFAYSPFINYRFSVDADVSYDDAYSDFTVYLPVDYVISDNFETYEVDAILTNSQVNKLKDLGYNLYNPYENSSINGGALLTLILLFIMLLIPVFIIYLITYLIYKNIFVSKLKEYTIMRILGINKKSSQKMLLLETSIVSIIALIFTIILSTFLGYYFNIILYRIVEVWIYVAYIFIMLMFIVFLGFKVNYNFFKERTTKTLVGERND